MNTLRKDKGRLVHPRIVPHQFVLKRGRGSPDGNAAALVVLALACHDETDLAAGIGGDARRGVLGVSEYVLTTGYQVPDEVEVDPHVFSLRTNDAVRSERVVHALVKLRFKQGLAGSERIQRVGKNDVEFVVVCWILDIFRGIGVDDFDPWIVEQPRRDEPQAFLGRVDHQRVDFDEGHLLDLLVPADFLEHEAVTATDDQDPFGIPVGEQREMGHHLVEGIRVSLGQLQNPVDREHLSVLCGLKDEN
eukprot:CAMPEP_0201271538 /NCGR_PEP_ID=MMETSP0853-20130426/38779_1 /ASSEMBLY_ACC=CAM_ASM_000640 /TAXON_ID=183588 /ORGANISM="Pseudo-nitzschia fraudulenta, Strain WWA7" /LENGTH=247 /DNA_ID=CAMNT_0047578157 /DNA_START=713 /DNA_END=1453 /DNA_ORIENTATION=+